MHSRLNLRILACLASIFATSVAVATTACACTSNCYGANYAAKKYTWGAILSDFRLGRDSNDNLISKSPWLIDTNHIDEALLVGPLVIWMQPNVKHGETGIPGCSIDLVSTALQVELKFDYNVDDREFDIRHDALPSRARLVFWFQTKIRSSGVTVNYAHRVNLLNYALTGKEIPPLRLLPDSKQWICLGQNKMFPPHPNNVFYGCAKSNEEFVEALSSVNVDMGLVLLLPVYDSAGKRIPWLSRCFESSESSESSISKCSECSKSCLRTPWPSKPSQILLKQFTITKTK